MDEYEQIYGTIETVVYVNDENEYCVLKVRDWNGEIITVVGCIPNAAPGEQIEATGKWENHQSYGKQFKAEMTERYLPTNEDDIRAYLTSGIIKGIGPATAAMIVGAFGVDSLNVILNEPEKLTSINGISMKKALDFSAIYKEKTRLKRLVEFLCPFGISTYIALRIDYLYNEDAMEKLQENPYLICEPNVGGSFSEADSIAMHFGISGNDTNRIFAAVIFELRYNLNNGHCFIPKETLIDVTCRMISADYDAVAQTLEKMICKADIIEEDIKYVKACYLPELYEAETDTARRIYNNRDNISIITGGPGTGKTTRVKQLIEKFEHDGLKFYLIAPTGRASKRMSEVTHRDASTIHRLLGAKFTPDGNGVQFVKCEKEKLVCDAVILDECSMVDIMTFNALLRALPDNCKLILVGDVDQLQAVGPGDVFKAMLFSGAFNTLKLTEVFRQSQDSKIVTNADLINHGVYPDFSANSGDFFRLRRLEGGSGVETICELCSTRLPNKMGIVPDDIQVISPTKKGDFGTRNLNKLLQKAINPPDRQKTEKTFGERVFRVGDRIMQIKNNYDMVWHNADYSVTSYGIYNGDIGYIVSMDIQNETFDCDFDGRICTYSFANFNEIDHAWAITVHKSQGSEYKAVILALSRTSRSLLSRDVLYTAVTRARDLLIIVGDDEVAKTMIDNSNKTKRYSFLRYRIKKLCGID